MDKETQSGVYHTQDGWVWKDRITQTVHGPFAKREAARQAGQQIRQSRQPRPFDQSTSQDTRR